MAVLAAPLPAALKYLYILQIGKLDRLLWKDSGHAGLSSLTSSVLTAVKSRTTLIVHVSVLEVGWALLQYVYLIWLYTPYCFKFVTTENIVDPFQFTDCILFVIIKHVWL